MRYFFHNIYGDAQELLDTLPADVQAVPFGWTPDVEDARNQLLSQLNATVSDLPSVLFLRPAHIKQFLIDGQMTDVQVPEAWNEIRVGDMSKPWTWQAIDQAITDITG